MKTLELSKKLVTLENKKETNLKQIDELQIVLKKLTNEVTDTNEYINELYNILINRAMLYYFENNIKIGDIIKDVNTFLLSPKIDINVNDENEDDIEVIKFNEKSIVVKALNFSDDLYKFRDDYIIKTNLINLTERERKGIFRIKNYDFFYHIVGNNDMDAVVEEYLKYTHRNESIDILIDSF